MAQIGGAEMRQLAKKIEKELPGLGFCLLVFEFYKPGMSNYISNAQREDMILALEETLKRWKDKTDFPTPETN
jgi:hypothetical protein